MAAHLDSAGVPDPDLLIRTSGEMRISNFYLWQIAYSELYVTPTLVAGFSREGISPGVARLSAAPPPFWPYRRTSERADGAVGRPMDANLSLRIATAAVGLPLLVWLVGWGPPWVFSATLFCAYSCGVARVFRHGVSRRSWKDQLGRHFRPRSFGRRFFSMTNCMPCLHSACCFCHRLFGLSA